MQRISTVVSRASAAAFVLACLLTVGLAAPASAVPAPDVSRVAATAIADAALDVHLGYADVLSYTAAGSVVDGSVALGTTTASGSGQYAAPDGPVYFSFSLHRSAETATGTGWMVWYGTGIKMGVLTTLLQGDWNSTTLSASANALSLNLGGGLIPILWAVGVSMSVTTGT